MGLRGRGGLGVRGVISGWRGVGGAKGSEPGALW